ncbi:phosphatidylinositol-4-phosphate 5-kinase-like, putative [Bodo saltans]|uniref:Phosphatidylinositol-4-phosphate 5-kinase-like, putative n=1 Tax=Bodo saltans TaxID=75058 RepID=A0A0S4IKA0_BODSA|nr:phosphatidylinositol-4-phosphate 5-kinase-like, putative [Bodo saltans]|eukprot:CUF04249.1 phosphatidylinositol-4-phosphate 5-kinase-like, putative [Bodo saltans]
MAASPMAVAVQQLTRELDACKKRIRKMEKENDKLRNQLQAMSTIDKNSSNGSEALPDHKTTHVTLQQSTTPPREEQMDSIELLVEGIPLREPSLACFDSPLATALAPPPNVTLSNGKATPNNGSVVSNFIGSPGSPLQQVLNAIAPAAGGSGSGNASSTSHPLQQHDAAPLVRFDSFSSTTNKLAATSATTSSTLFSAHPRSRSYEPQVVSLGGSINISGGNGLPLTGAAAVSGAAHLNALRRRVEAYEEREVSWREQIMTLNKTMDTMRRDHLQQIDTLEETIETLQQQLREAKEELTKQQMQQSQVGTSPGSGSLGNSFIGNTANALSSSTEVDVERSLQLRRRSKSQVVLKKTSDSGGRGMLIAELPKADLDEDIFVTHSNHVRTISNNLVPFSAAALVGNSSSLTGSGPGGAGASTQIASTGSGNGSQQSGAYALTNPNQLGEAVTDTVKNKQWYLQNVLKLSLYKAFSNDKTLVPTAAAPPAPSGLDSTLSSTLSTAGNAITLQGRSMNSIAAMVKESYDLHYYIKNNAVVQSDVEITNLPPFHKQNSDPALLHCFSSSSTGTTVPDAENGASDGANNERVFPRLNARSDQVRVLFTGLTLFRYIRTFLHFDLDLFLHSVVEATWRESVSPGKSDASMFFFGHFVIKSVKESEYRFLKDSYVGMFARYAEMNPHTLISKFYSLFSVYNVRKGTRCHFVVMNNVFWTRHYINRIFDIKGSSAGRDVDAHVGTRTAYGALLLKDNDLPSQLIICGPMKRATLLAQLRSDTSFLASLSIVDYSCVIGIRTRLFTREQRHQHIRAQQQSVGGAELFGAMGAEDFTFSFTAADGGILSLPIYAENDTTTVREDTYYIGLIDVLQMYTAQKRLEHFAKGLLRDRHTISVVPPGEFSERLCKVLERITV